MKIYAVSLGCPKNSVDTECALKEIMNADGKASLLVGSPEEADLLFVNTCGFIEAAVNESVDTILALGGQKRPDQSLMVMGCMVARYGKEALEKELPEVDSFIGVYDWASCDSRTAGAGPLAATPPWRAYVKISEGCSNHCTYCLIPRLRGGQRSRPMKEIVSEARNLAKKGVKEITFVGQDLTAYGENGAGLTELLEEIALKADIPWIRLLYLNPAKVTSRLLDAMASHPAICQYLDIPVQHASDKVLRAMGRGYGIGLLRDLFAEARLRLPNASLRTTVMVGFPGEDQDDFEMLADFIKSQQLDHVGVFAYSDEEESASFRMNGKVQARTARQRKAKIMSIQARIARSKNAKKRGSVEEVLVEGFAPETNLLLMGRARFQAPDVDGVVYINEGTASAGELVKVDITGSHIYDLVGRIA
ncbi:MAG: 30S ribosomal protein S12 methylthiotransferase RimO [Desulfobacteraceae bacterium]|nr:30S ribosomal protein S12 methylthiotransferase RimO [Desulfobacteraceae bacterium]